MIDTPILIFLLIVALTLAITYWAAKRSVDRSDYYTAGGQITATQNGLAITGDFVSAAAILGSVALYYAAGLDAAIFYISPLVGLCLLLLLIARPLRELGKYTVGDVLAAKLPGRSIRIYTAISTLILSELYVVAQLVGAGNLFSIVFDISYELAVGVVALLIVAYVAFGGMLATTWVQIVKAGLLIVGVLILGVLSVSKAGSFGALYAQAEQAYGGSLGFFGGSGMSVFSAASLAVAIVLGMMGMPHLLIRFLTVPDPASARRSVVVTAVLVAGVLGVLLLAVGPATLAYVKGEAAYQTASGTIQGGRNMILLHLSTALGGEVLFGIITAVTFSTILAVVAGLAIAMSSSAAHDIYAVMTKKPGGPSERSELAIFRTAAVVTTALAALISVALQNENIAYLSAFAFGIAASTNFPILILALYWPRLTLRGALAGGTAGLATALVLLMLGPTIWVQLLGNADPIFPSDYSTLVSTPLAFMVAWVVSLLDSAPQRQVA